MIVYPEIIAVREYCRNLRHSGKKIGFVPTMGYLHEGHLSLVRVAKAETDAVAVSIYVNPMQFGPNEDLQKYPRDLERDLALLEKVETDLVFVPSEEMMNSPPSDIRVVPHALSQTLCGKFRPGHFEGVVTVVTKLFNIIQPQRAYFGQKDAQQCIIIQQLVKDLNFDIEIVVCPIIRENDGLAKSSRNVYLSSQERQEAPVLYQALQLGEKMIREGEKKRDKIIGRMKEMVYHLPTCTRVDYIEVVDAETLQPLVEIKGKILIALAVYIGKTRLIDNSVVTI